MNTAYSIPYVACFAFLVNVTFLHAHFHNHHTVSCGDSTLHHEKLNQQKIYETRDHNDNQLNGGRNLASGPERIRIKILYDHYTNDKYMCTKVGQTVDPCESRGSGSCVQNCEKQDIVTEEIAQIATKRVEWAVEKTASVIKLTSSRVSPLDVNKASLGSWGIYVDQLKNDVNMFEATDLVIIVTLRKHNSNSVAGYAGCIKHDINKRCILGYFNYSPRIFNVKETDSPNVVETERRTGLHEIFHVLGAGEDDFDFMRSKEIRDEEHEAAEHLQRLFRGYRLRMKLKEAAVTVAVSQFVHKSPTHIEVTDYIFKDRALGIDLGETIDPETGNVIVKCMGIHPGSTASYTKLKCFDVLVGVNDLSIVDMSPAEFNNCIANTERPIKLAFAGQRKDVGIATMATSDSISIDVESTEATGIELKLIKDKKGLL
eukprot:g1738.t1